MKKHIGNPPQCLLDVWKKNYLYEYSKFMTITYLTLEDLYTDFEDGKGVTWKIMGKMDNGDIICKNLKSEHFYTWDKWKVSMLKRPEKHEIVGEIKKVPKTKKIEIIEEKEWKQSSINFDNE